MLPWPSSSKSKTLCSQNIASRLRQRMNRRHPHLDFISLLPCAICGDNTSTEVAHVRFADPRAAKPITGIGRKAGDEWTVPLCSKHHREQHAWPGGEQDWWKNSVDRDPIFLALALHSVSGNHEAGCQILENQ